MQQDEPLTPPPPTEGEGEMKRDEPSTPPTPTEGDGQSLKKIVNV